MKKPINPCLWGLKVVFIALAKIYQFYVNETETEIVR